MEIHRTSQRVARARVQEGVRTRRGQIVMFVGLLFPVLLGFLGLSLDIGFMYHVKRRLQTAADAGAMGGAREIWRANTTLVTSAAKNDVTLNGYDDKNATVTVNNPPASGPHAGDAGFVEVIISQQAPTFFMRIIDQQSTLIKARAVAGLARGAEYCVLALNPTQPGALTVGGTATLDTTCGVMVNSSDPKALTENGGGCVYASGIGSSGGYTSGGADCFTPKPVTGVPPAIDPLGYMTPPPRPTTVRSAKTLKINGTVTLDPGLYVGGIWIQSGANVTFNPGVYYIDQDWLAVSGSAVLNGTGVTFYTTNTSGKKANWGTFQISGGIVGSLKAPSSGPYAGVLFWADRNTPNDPAFWSVINGGSDLNLEGAIYLPSVNVSYTGTGSSAGWSMLIADSITVTGNALVQGNYSASTVPVPTRLATLVE